LESDDCAVMAAIKPAAPPPITAILISVQI